MGNMIFRIVMFSLCLNLATGFLTNFVMVPCYTPGCSGEINMLTALSSTSGLVYYENMSNNLTTTFNQSIMPTSIATDTSTWVFRLLDLIGLGFIGRIIDTINFYLFGFIIFLMKIVGPFFSPLVASAIKGMLYTINWIIYGLGIYQLYKGRDVTE